MIKCVKNTSVMNNIDKYEKKAYHILQSYAHYRKLSKEKIVLRKFDYNMDSDSKLAPLKYTNQ